MLAHHQPHGVAYSVARRHLERKRIPLVERPSQGSLDDAIAHLPDDFDLEAAAADAELLAALRVEVEQLPPLQRTVLTLYHLDELSIEEIARITGVPGGTVKSHLFRCRAKLRARLAERIGDIA